MEQRTCGLGNAGFSEQSRWYLTSQRRALTGSGRVVMLVKHAIGKVGRYPALYQVDTYSRYGTWSGTQYRTPRLHVYR